MRIGSAIALAVFCLGSFALEVRAEDDVAAILADLASADVPCAGQIDAFDGAVSLDPSNRSARRARGVCLYRLGRLELARADLKIGLDPVSGVTETEPLVVGAILEAREGEQAQARAWLDRARSLSSRSDPMVLRGVIVVQGVSGDFPGAWKELDRALERSAEDPVLRVAAMELIALDPDGASEVARAAIGRRVKSVTRHNRASGWLSAGQPAACVHEADGAIADADREDIEAIAALHVLAWRCGVAAEQVGPATRHLKAMGKETLSKQPAGTVIAHVRLLRDAGQVRSALKLLALTRPVSDLDGRDVATLAVGLRILLGDLDGALVHATEEASPVSRANLAKALHEAGRTAEAVALLDRSCAELDDAPGCVSWREHLRGGL